MRWLVLLMSLPPTPTRHRVGVWRKLKRMGAVNLRGSAWILPENPETTELFQWLVQEVQSFGGEATLLRVDGIETMSDEAVTALFNGARTEEYQMVKQECRELL
ncbi:MAG: ChrB protein, partial [Candidatus Rokuibacteriota bacterium]